MKKNNQNNYQTKNQAKFEGKMKKYHQKSSLKHEDDIIRLNRERKRKVEEEQAGIERGQRLPDNTG